MKELAFKKMAIIVCLLCAAMIFVSAKCFAQDTVWNVRKVLICKQELSRKTGAPVRTWYKKVTVKKGYIIKEANGFFLINGKEMIPDNFTYMPVKYFANKQ